MNASEAHASVMPYQLNWKYGPNDFTCFGYGSPSDQEQNFGFSTGQTQLAPRWK